MNKKFAAFAGLTALVFLEGCVSQPYGPTVPVMPAPNKPFSEFQRDDAECQDYADSRVSGRARDANNRAIASTLIGAGLGAALGGAVGGGHGAGIGAAAGGVAGAAYGSNDARYAQGTLQGRYNLAYAQCMESKGNEVPPPPGMGPGPGPGPDGDEYRDRYNDRYDDRGPPPPPPGY